ncbi:LysM peptidoglycan-binding domain-containing protein [Hyphococcus sp.]|uniref:LysM peptidoglycan-binding domain-containing protein n=1 Tax=Hyphococcus sp. TaxID=2038636 RepID=UPI002085457A|nr:MAG: hypothetical protein DHS20C04_19130 [Marinicaulis sp.]
MSMDAKYRFGLAAAALSAGLLTASPAIAGRCGHSYPVDSPTTLAKVARACNVSLSALREANTGVNPDHVAPGEHLAVPDEIASATDIPSGGANVEVADNFYDTPIYHYAEYSEPAYSSTSPSTTATSISPIYISSSTAPYFVRASALGAPITMRDDPTLSYQKLSAARIRNAGIQAMPTAPMNFAPLRPVSPNSVMVSTRGDMMMGDPLSPLMECAVLRRQENGKIKQVREFKPMPEGREAPAHCSAVTNASMNGPVFLNNRVRVGDFLRSEYEGSSPSAVFTILQGYISNADAECVTLRADDGMVWRIGVPLAPMEMLGKEATIWAELTDSPQCGGLTMNRAVYAERVN